MIRNVLYQGLEQGHPRQHRSNFIFASLGCFVRTSSSLTTNSLGCNVVFTDPDRDLLETCYRLVRDM